MTTDPFTEAARAEAERYFADPGVDPLTLSVIDHAMHLAEWARTYLTAQETDGGHGPRTTAAIREWTGAWPAAQEPTDAECLAVLNVALVPLGEPPKRNDLADWNPAAVERVRAALSAARAARRDEEKR